MPTSLLTGERVDMLPGSDSRHSQGKIKKPMPYPSPFFDLSKFYFPRSVKELFKWCRHYYKTMGLVSTTIYKLSEYPITDLIHEIPDEIEDEKGAKKLKNALDKRIKLKDFLIKYGLDYFTYGNTLISMYFPFKRTFVCPSCNHPNQLEDFGGIGKKHDLDFVNYEFKGVCPHCNSNVKFEINDVTVKQLKKVNIIRHNPEHFDIEYNDITGQHKYYYNIPNKMKKKIVGKDEDTLMTAPKIYFEALKENKAVKMKNSNIYHSKRADVSDNDMEWGMPIILPVMRDMFHLQVLRKAQQEIAMEHLVPLRILFPGDNQSGAAPHRRTGLGSWKSHVEEEIRKWKRDPNYIPIMPVPLGTQKVSGDGKMLLLNQEMRMVSENIINGMGAPQEFVFGGLTWSGSSISLRMLENHFLVYRESLLEMINEFIIPKLATFLDVKPYQVKMQEFKMADDVQRKQLLQQLNQMDKVSDSTFLKEVAGLDSDSELKQTIKDYKDKLELFKLKGLEQGTIQGKVQELVTRAGITGQQKAAEDQEKGANDKPPTDVGGFWDNYIQMIEEEQAMEQAMAQQEDAEGAQVPQDPEDMAYKYAQELVAMPDEEKEQVIQRMQQEMPQMAQLIIEKYQELEQGAAQPAPQGDPQTAGEQLDPQVDMRPNPEKAPPRRDNTTI